MARIRTIKPEFPQSESIGRLSRDARLLFIQLWTICDDEGRCRAAPKMLASLLYPYDLDAGELLEMWLGELAKEGCVRRYQQGGSNYLEVVNWLKHQKIERPSKSRLPSFGEHSPKPPRLFDEPSVTDLGPRTIGPRTMDHGPVRREPAPNDAEFEAWYAAYPMHKARGQAMVAFRAARQKTELQTLIDGARRYASDPTRKPEYTKHPATWLRGMCWNDEAVKPNGRDAFSGGIGI